VFDVSLTVNGQQFTGWVDVTINLGVEQIAGDFRITATHRWPGGWDGQPFKDGDACAVAIDGETVITGFVDMVGPSYDASAHIITIEGRDRAGDLVDCSAVHKSGHWRGATIQQIAGDLAKPLSVGVTLAGEAGDPFKDFAIQEGETVFEALGRAAAMRGLLAVSDGKGGVTLTRAGTQRCGTTLQNPGNILAASGEYSSRDQFSTYIVKGQRRGFDTDAGAPDLLSSAEGAITDSAVRRYRPMVILAEDQGDAKTFKRRAAWEQATRAAKAFHTRLTVQGWRESGETGPLWRINKLVRVIDPWQWLDSDLLITGLSFVKSEGGTVCHMQLANPKAYELPPVSA
jgi:prophage tail gpP-like protein